MTRRLLSCVATWIPRIAVGGALLAGGALKIPEPGEFQIAIEAYRLVPREVATALALALPVLEIVAGLAIVAVPGFRLAGWLLAAPLCAGFAAFVLVGVARGLEIPCGCFGSTDSALGPPDILRTLALVALSLWGLWSERSLLLAHAAQPA
jgi:putative oxidoreductase